MKIVLDTNVFVSGLLSPFGSPGEIVRMVASNILQLCFDSRIITEYHLVLKRAKFKLNQDKVSILLDQIESYGYIVSTEPLKYNLPDKNDEAFLEVAITAKAEYLVTGNIRHYPVKMRQKVEVVTPDVFLEEYRKKKYSIL